MRSSIFFSTSLYSIKDNDCDYKDVWDNTSRVTFRILAAFYFGCLGVCCFMGLSFIDSGDLGSGSYGYGFSVMDHGSLTVERRSSFSLIKPKTFDLEIKWKFCSVKTRTRNEDYGYRLYETMKVQFFLE
ncbi:hypothetical protein Tco_0147652 [Tanacetum coccineum]